MVNDLGILYERYKLPFWIILTILFGSGAITNYFNGTKIEVMINGILFVISLFMAIYILIKTLKDKQR